MLVQIYNIKLKPFIVFKFTSAKYIAIHFYVYVYVCMYACSCLRLMYYNIIQVPGRLNKLG